MKKTTRSTNKYQTDSSRFEWSFLPYSNYRSRYAISGILLALFNKNLAAKWLKTHLNQLPQHFLLRIEENWQRKILYNQRDRRKSLLRIIKNNHKKTTLSIDLLKAKWKTIISAIEKVFQKQNTQKSTNNGLLILLLVWKIYQYFTMYIYFYLLSFLSSLLIIRQYLVIFPVVVL